MQTHHRRSYENLEPMQIVGLIVMCPLTYCAGAIIWGMFS